MNRIFIPILAVRPLFFFIIPLIFFSLANVSCTHFLEDEGSVLKSDHHHKSLMGISTIQGFRHESPGTRYSKYHELCDSDVIRYSSALSQIFFERGHHNRLSRNQTDIFQTALAAATVANGPLGLSSDVIAFLGIGQKGILDFHPERNTQVFFEASRRIKKEINVYYGHNQTPSTHCLTKNGAALLASINMHFDNAYAVAKGNTPPVPTEDDQKLMKMDKTGATEPANSPKTENNKKTGPTPLPPDTERVG